MRGPIGAHSFAPMKGSERRPSGAFNKLVPTSPKGRDLKSLGNGLVTKSFKYEDLERVIEFLKKKYKLKCTIQKAGKEEQYIIYF